jgi:hypothetical protein
MFLYIVILCIFNSMLLYTYYIISLRMLIHIVNYCIREKIHKLEKLVSDPYLLYLANKNMFKLNRVCNTGQLISNHI